MVDNVDVDEVFVALPPTDRPAAQDEVSIRLFQLMRGRVRRVQVLALVALVITAAFFAVLALAPWRTDAVGVALGVLLLAGFAASGGGALSLTTRFGAWIRSAPALFEQQWRPAAARVLTGGNNPVLEITEPGAAPAFLQATSMPEYVWQVAARTGRVWLLGPDDKHWAALRVAGLMSPWPARRVSGATDDSPVRVLDDEGLRAAVLAKGKRNFLTVVLAYTGMLVMGLSLLVWGLDGPFSLLLPGAWLVLFTGYLLIWTLTRYARWRRLPRLLAAGPWQAVPAQLEPWNIRFKGLEADVKGEIVLADGARCAIKVRGNEDLVRAVRTSGTMYVAGTATPGSTVAVGMPGYPILGIGFIAG